MPTATSRDLLAYSGRFVRLAEADRHPVEITIDGRRATALRGDTVLTVLLVEGGHVRRSEFGDGVRAGFCLMGACQDCWVWTADGQRIRACTTEIVEGMHILTEPTDSLWPASA